MEFYLMMTKHCNLSCRYCSGVNIKSSRNSEISRPELDRQLDYVFKVAGKYPKDKHSLMFYGGEPLLNLEGIEEVIKRTQNTKFNFQYLIYTNGTLLNRASELLLENLSYIFVSIDGLEEVHDAQRGKGSFRKILSNLENLSSAFAGEKMARITVTNIVPLYDSVMNLLDKFEHIYWSVENTSELYPDEDEYQARYLEDQSRLIEFWVRELERGKLWNIVPFQGTAWALLSGEKIEQPWCGFGSVSNIVDLDGTAYLCDELVENPEFVWTSSKYIGWKPPYQHPDCQRCPVKFICGGRCGVAMLFHPPERRKRDCLKVIKMIQEIERKLPRIEDALKKHQIPLNALASEVVLDHCEVMP